MYLDTRRRLRKLRQKERCVSLLKQKPAFGPCAKTGHKGFRTVPLRPNRTRPVCFLMKSASPVANIVIMTTAVITLVLLKPTGQSPLRETGLTSLLITDLSGTFDGVIATSLMENFASSAWFVDVDKMNKTILQRYSQTEANGGLNPARSSPPRKKRFLWPQPPRVHV